MDRLFTSNIEDREALFKSAKDAENVRDNSQNCSSEQKNARSKGHVGVG